MQYWKTTDQIAGCKTTRWEEKSSGPDVFSVFFIGPSFFTVSFSVLTLGLATGRSSPL